MLKDYSFFINFSYLFAFACIFGFSFGVFNCYLKVKNKLKKLSEQIENERKI
jgi:hypothetical protein